MTKKQKSKKAKAFLWGYKAAKIQIRQYEIESRALLEQATRLNAPIDKERVQSSGTGDAIANAAVNIADISRKFDETASEYKRQMETILAVIKSIQDGRQRNIITMRYINGLSWKKISAAMYCSETVCYSEHGAALLEVYDLLEGWRCEQ